MNNEIEEMVAIIIFNYHGGLYPGEYENIVGKPKPKWYGEGPDCLAEHERDEYRLQAEKVLEFLAKILKFNI